MCCKPPRNKKEYDYFYKILLIGNTEIGKTFFLTKASDPSFMERANHMSKIGLK